MKNNLLHQLNLYTSDGVLIGKISYSFDTELFSFEYNENWIKSPDGYPISPSINFETIENSSTIKKFFENLLPEGDGLNAVAQSNKVSKKNTFAILNAIGHECTGGLIITQSGFNFADKKQPTQNRLIKEDELIARIQSRDTIPFCSWDDKVRLSIAGFQDKIAVFIDNEDNFSFVEYPLASTHILKPLPRNPELSSLVTNECYCMNLANLVGLQSANTRIKRLKDDKNNSIPVLLIERFDRVFNKDKQTVSRLHIIDGCQLLNMSSFMKYERNFGSGRDVTHIREGVSLKKLFNCADLMVDKDIFTRQLLRLTLFNYIIGNADAHGKNISFFVNKGGDLNLAPVYDVVSTVIYSSLESDMAFSIGDEFKFNEVCAYQWALFAHDCDIAIDIFIEEMNLVSRNIIEFIENDSVNLVGFSDSEIMDIKKIQEFAMKQCLNLIENSELIAQLFAEIKIENDVELTLQPAVQ